jgi:hypothetical protein
MKTGFYVLKLSVQTVAATAAMTLTPRFRHPVMNAFVVPGSGRMNLNLPGTRG